MTETKLDFLVVDNSFTGHPLTGHVQHSISITSTLSCWRNTTSEINYHDGHKVASTTDRTTNYVSE